MAKLEKIEGIFRNLDRYVAILRDLAAMPKEALLADPVRLGGARYYLQVAVECCDDFDRFQAAIYAYLQRSALFDQADGENA